jgi:uncharacterized linocin/CFP29 family protein
MNDLLREQAPISAQAWAEIEAEAKRTLKTLRGARDADLDPVRNAARAAGIAEDRAIFRGYEPAGIVGIFEGSASQSLSIPANYDAYPDVVAEATHRLRSEGCRSGFSQASARLFSTLY